VRIAYHIEAFSGIGGKIQQGHFDQKFQIEGVAPHQSFLHG